MEEKIYLTNLQYRDSIVLLRVWKPKEKDNVSSRLDCYKQFSHPFEGANKHKEIREAFGSVDRIKIIKEIKWSDDTYEKYNRLLDW